MLVAEHKKALLLMNFGEHELLPANLETYILFITNSAVRRVSPDIKVPDFSHHANKSLDIFAKFILSMR